MFVADVVHYFVIRSFDTKLVLNLKAAKDDVFATDI